MVHGALLVKWVILGIEYHMKWSDVIYIHSPIIGGYRLWELSIVLMHVSLISVPVEDLVRKGFSVKGMYDQDQVIRLEWWISVMKYIVQDQVNHLGR